MKLTVLRETLIHPCPRSIRLMNSSYEFSDCINRKVLSPLFVTVLDFATTALDRRPTIPTSIRLTKQRVDLESDSSAVGSFWAWVQFLRCYTKEKRLEGSGILSVFDIPQLDTLLCDKVRTD